MLNKKETKLLKKIYYWAAIGQYSLITSIICFPLILLIPLIFGFVLEIPFNKWGIPFQVVIYSSLVFCIIGCGCWAYTLIYSTMSTKYIKIAEKAGKEVDKTKGLAESRKLYSTYVLSNIIKPMRMLVALPGVGALIGLCISVKNDARTLAECFEIKLIKKLPLVVFLIPVLILLCFYKTRRFTMDFTTFVILIFFIVPTLIWILWTVLFAKKWKEGWKNRKAPKLEYVEESWNIGFHLFFLLLIVVSLTSEPISSKTIIICTVISLVYLGIWSIHIKKIFINKNKVRKGIKCQGKIIGVVIDRSYDRIRSREIPGSAYSTSYYLKIEYYSPSKCELVQFVTPTVVPYPVAALSSVDVDVYEQKDGSAWATGFRQAKYNRDSLEFKESKIEEFEK